MTPVDPGPNPLYPDRPDHQDFRDLSVAVQANDAFADPLSEVGVDSDSLVYMATARTEMAAALTRSPGEASALLMTFIDGFALGKTFAENRAKNEQEDA